MSIYGLGTLLPNMCCIAQTLETEKSIKDQTLQDNEKCPTSGPDKHPRPAPFNFNRSALVVCFRLDRGANHFHLTLRAAKTEIM